jgi:hypothetical protein
MFKLAVVAAVGVTVLASTAIAVADPLDPDERECPADVRGVRIASAPVKGGVAFMFTARKATQLPGLRSLLRDAASIVERQTQLAALHPEVMPSSDPADSVAALDITVRNAPMGAIVTVRPEDTLHVALLQQNAHDFELFWASHACVSEPAMAHVPTRRAVMVTRR